MAVADRRGRRTGCGHLVPDAQGRPRQVLRLRRVHDERARHEVRCSDGSTKFIPPQFSVANASGRPIHKGKICLDGTACNASADFEGGDRRLGDFFTVNFDHKGNIYIASGDTMLGNPLGGPNPIGHPIFMRQKSGDPLLVKPDKIRKSRCLYPLPSC